MLYLAVLSISTLLPAADAVQADYVIRGATLFDGARKPGVVGDLAIKGERIVAIGHFTTAGNPKVLDGSGLIVAPGFIDLHTHCDSGAPRISDPAGRSNLCYLMQGVTTVVTGNCGTGPYNVGEFYRRLDKGRIGTNVAHQVPHNDVRRAVMGNANRPPSPAELKRMEALVDKGMKDGAWSLSTGLYYNPGTFAQKEELIALARVAAKHGGFYASHIRDEGAGVLASIDEAITIGREGGLPAHISHLKAFGPKSWGKSTEEIALIMQARNTGQVVTADQYPYHASSTQIVPELVPPQFRTGGDADFFARLNDAEQGPRIRQAISQRIDDLNAGASIRIARFAFQPRWQGMTLEAIAAKTNKSVLEVVLDIIRHGGAQIVDFSMKEEDVRLIMKQPFVATASDGSSQVPGDSMPHPRSYGCFPRKIGRYAVEDKIVSLEQAIRSASGLPADILHVPERGYLKPGYFADVVVFDPQTYRDQATFEKPHQYATGVRYLFVNGALTISEGKYTNALAGKALRHREKQK